jgi:hypothetical protein
MSVDASCAVIWGAIMGLGVDRPGEDVGVRVCCGDDGHMYGRTRFRRTESRKVKCTDLANLAPVN